ncbi:MAG: hypothetical protein HY587_06365 [Candidatus Omnitrophica bacterium]|nr:hypothetical protein [Candidatus Omnitrophota bacterium]
MRSKTGQINKPESAELETAGNALQLAYILDFNAMHGRPVRSESMSRLIAHLAELAERTRSAQVEGLCAAAVSALKESISKRISGLAVPRELLKQIASHYGHQKLFI